MFPGRRVSFCARRIGSVVAQFRKVLLVDEKVAFRKDDVLWAAVRNDRRAAVDEELRQLGWVPAPAQEQESAA